MLAFLIFRIALSFGLRRVNVQDPLDDNDDGEMIDNHTINIVKHRDIGDCACDVTDQCDLHCCCDPDCPESVVNVWKGLNDYKVQIAPKKCLPEKSNIKDSERKALRKCSEDLIEGDGSLLDWIQRTMLCISRNNNPSRGKFFELKTKSETKGFTEMQSSLGNSFIPKENNDDNVLRPLMSDINIKYIFEVGSNKSLRIYLTELCYDLDGDELEEIESCFEENETTDSYCPEGYAPNENECLLIPDGPVSGPNSTPKECPENYQFNGTHCVLNCSNVTFQNPDDTFIYQKNKHIYFKCNYNSSIDSNPEIETQSEDDIIGYTQSVNISNIKCINKTYCTAIFQNDTARADCNVSCNSSEDSDLADSSGSAQLLSSILVENKTLKISFLWPRNEDAKNLPRGYYFSEEILDENDQPIEIDAPGNGNQCNQNKTPIRFGMNTDFTCMTSMRIDSCNLTNETIFDEYCNFSSLSITPDFGCIKQVPFPSSEDEPTCLTYNAPDFNDHYNYDVILNESNLTLNDDELEVDSFYLTGISRSIDIFYKTVGYEHNPTHIIMNVDVKYNYSTSIKYLDTSFVEDYQYVTLRTIIRFFEYPNNLNMYRGSSTNTKLQSWLPFEV